MNNKYDVFVSYRRIDGSHLAQLMRQSLAERGYRVFMDVREMPAGPFPDSITDAIRETPNFIPLLTAQCLDRFGQASDWFGRELQLALEVNRHIVPLRTHDFQPPTDASKSDVLNRVLQLHHIIYHHEYSDAAIDALCQRLLNPPEKQPGLPAPAQAPGGFNTVPVNIIRNKQWALNGSVKEVSFLLGKKTHTIKLQRQDHLVSQDVELTLDGESIFKKHIGFPMISFIREQFLIDGLVCNVAINFVTAGWFGNIKVAGHTVLDESLLGF